MLRLISPAGFSRSDLSSSREEIKELKVEICTLPSYGYRRAVALVNRQRQAPSDNAAREGFFGRVKNKRFYARDWLNTTIDDFTAALENYIRWYIDARIKISLGYRSPMEHSRALGKSI